MKALIQLKNNSTTSHHTCAPLLHACAKSASGQSSRLMAAIPAGHGGRVKVPF